MIAKVDLKKYKFKEKLSVMIKLLMGDRARRTKDIQTLDILHHEFFM